MTNRKTASKFESGETRLLWFAWWVSVIGGILVGIGLERIFGCS